VDAAELLRKEPGLKIVLIGDGSEHQRLIAEAERCVK
jgi:phosphatidate phosphatase APP1